MPYPRSTLRLRLLPLLLLLGACGPSGDTLEPLDLGVPLGPDEARAGILGEDLEGALVGGTAAEAAPGDYVLVNDRARFIVRGLRAGDGYVGEPGALMDLDVVRPEGQPGRDGLDDLLCMADFGRLLVADRFEVLRDGRQGGPALLAWSGHDAPIPFIEGMLESPGLFPPNGVEVTQLFRLEPGSPALEVTTSLRNPGTETLRLSLLDAGMTDVSTHQAFVPGAGFTGQAPGDALPMVAVVSRMNDQAWALFRPDADLDRGIAGLADALDMLLAQGDILEIPPGGTASYTRFVAVGRDLASLEAFRRELRGLPTGRVSGTLREKDGGTPVAGARVFLMDLEGAPITLAFTDAQGAFSLAAEPGDYRVVALGDATNEVMDLPAGPGSYGVFAEPSANRPALDAFTDPDSASPSPLADGYGRAEPVDLRLEEGEDLVQDIEIEAPARLRLRVIDEGGTPLPALAQLRYPAGATDPRPADARLGERRPRGGARRAAWLLDGDMEIPVPAGTWDLVVQHGPRYEWVFEEGLALGAGERRELTVTLRAAFEAEGWISVDSHAHAAPSIDGEVTVEERLLSALAADLRVHVSTDHDIAADYRPVARAMGVEGRLVSVPGTEFSTNLRGHFNLWPFEPDPSLPSGGSPRWWTRQVDSETLLAWAREALGSDSIVQVNHGTGGLFSLSGYDPATGEAARPDRYTENFDTMEVLNSNDVDLAPELREIWCSLLQDGTRRIAVGTSDSHGMLPGSGVGRTWIPLGKDDIYEDDVPDVLDALLAGRAVVSSGPILDLEATDGAVTAGLGETLTASEALLRIRLRVPSWMPVDELRLYGPECDVIGSWRPEPVDGAWEMETSVEAWEDAFFFVEVEGWSAMDPAWTGARPYALTNPVFLAP